MRPDIKQAMIDGVMTGVQSAVANSHHIYHVQLNDPTQRDRTFAGLCAIALAADDMLVLINGIRE
jgi:hypothetical protein